MCILDPVVEFTFVLFSQENGPMVHTEQSNDVSDLTNIPNLNLTIPCFSDGVRSALKDGNSLEVWNQMIEELLVYYIREYPTRLRCSNDYQQIGKLMYKTYPCTS